MKNTCRAMHKSARGLVCLLGLAASFYGQLAEAATATCGNLTQEAETGALNGNFGIISSSGASGGQAVEVPANTTSTTNSLTSDYVEYCFNVAQAGTYQIHGTARASGSSYNSFNVTVNNDTSNVYAWAFTANNSYVTEAISGGNGSGNIEEFTLSAGENRVRFYLREDGAKLDKVSLVLQGGSNTNPTVTISSGPSSAVAGSSVSFVASATDTEDGSLSGNITWSSNLDGALSTGATLTTSSLSEGSHTITATVTDSGGLPGSDTHNISITFGGGSVADIIVDNTDSNTSQIGTWSTSSNTPPYGSNSVYRSDTGSFIWTPTINTAGQYEVYVWWTQHSNRTQDAHYSISHSGGVSNVTGVNQTTSGGVWNLLGTYTFNVGDTDITLESRNDAGHSFSADAIKLVYVGGGSGNNSTPAVSVDSGPATAMAGDTLSFAASATDTEDGNLSSSISWASSLDGSLGSAATLTTSNLSVGTHILSASVTDSGGLTASATHEVTILSGSVDDIIVDNADSNTSQVGSWTTSGNTPPWGANSVYLKVAGSFSWLPNITTDGEYQVYAWWTPHSNRSQSAPYTINHANGSDTATVDQTINGGQWNLLGTHTFNTGSTDITLTSRDDGGRSFSADAIKLVYVSGTGGSSGGTATISIISGPSTATAGDSISFTATATDANGNDISSSISWSSSLDGNLNTTGGTLTINTLSEGTHTITATASGVGSDTFMVTIQAASGGGGTPPAGSCSPLAFPR